MAGNTDAEFPSSDAPLSDAAVADWLSAHGDWQRIPGDPDLLERDFVLADFLTAVHGVQRIALLAEAANHHPDLTIHGYKRLRVQLTTHSSKAISAKDLALAEQVDGLAL